MNVHHESKTIIWLPQRSGSRTVNNILLRYNLIDDDRKATIIGMEYSHTLDIPAGCEDYKIACTVRNPYTWILSVYAWEWVDWPDIADCDRISFSTYLETKLGQLDGIQDNLIKYKVDYPLRLEFLTEDLKQLPFYNQTPEDISYINNNLSSSISLKRDNSNRFTDYKSYYTEKDYEIVRKKFKFLFETFNYEM